MHRSASAILLAAALAAAGACGSSEQEKQADETSKAAEQAAKGAEGVAESAQQMAKGMEEMAKSLQGLAGGAGSAKPVAFRDLYPYFPEVSGWEMGKPSGEGMSAPVPHSQASVQYRKGDSALEVRIVDSAMSGLLLAPYTVLLQAGYEKETEFVRERAMKVKGYPAFEKWELENTDGELMAVVGNRFLVMVEGNDIPDTKVLHDVMERIDLAKLESLR